nr:MAG TPA: hypothetical protein [Caudoviricetes sp.]
MYTYLQQVSLDWNVSKEPPVSNTIKCSFVAGDV